MTTPKTYMEILEDLIGAVEKLTLADTGLIPGTTNEEIINAIKWAMITCREDLAKMKWVQERLKEIT